MRVVSFGSTKIRVSAPETLKIIYMFSTCFIDSRGEIFACGCEFCIKSRATATFCKSDSGVRARNVALVSTPVTFPEIAVVDENRRKSKTCISHALELYFRAFQK